MLVFKLEFETYLGVAQELCDSKESVLKQETNSRSWFRLREYWNFNAVFNTAWCQLVFFVYVLYKSLCKIKSCQNFTPKRDDSTFVSFKWEFPRDDWALSAFSKKEILIHISCTESVDFYYFLTVFHRYNYTYLELIFIKKDIKVILMTDIEDVTWRYEISLRVLKNISQVSACSIYYINTNELPNYFTLIVFWCERRDLLGSHSNSDIITREDNMLFSHVKISSFRAKAHLVFQWCLYIKLLSLKATNQTQTTIVFEAQTWPLVSITWLNWMREQFQHLPYAGASFSTLGFEIYDLVCMTNQKFVTTFLTQRF